MVLTFRAVAAFSTAHPILIALTISFGTATFGAVAANILFDLRDVCSFLFISAAFAGAVFVAGLAPPKTLAIFGFTGGFYAAAVNVPMGGPLLQEIEDASIF